MYFKEKTPLLYKVGIIINILLISGMFISIDLTKPSNYCFLPIGIAISIILIIYSCHYLSSHSKIGVFAESLSVSKNGRYKGCLDVESKIKIINGKMIIPYKEIQGIKVYSHKIYLKYKGILNFIVLEPKQLNDFLLILENKIKEQHLAIPINKNAGEIINEETPVFRNNILNNVPTIIAFTIFLAPLNCFSAYNLVKYSDYFFFISTSIASMGIYFAIFAYKELIILSDKELIKWTKFGSIDLGIQKISYNKINGIKKTKYRVDLKTKSGYIYLVITDKDKFCELLNSKINNNNLK